MIEIEADPFELHAARFLSRLQSLTQSFRTSSEPVEFLLRALDKQRPQIDAAFAWADNNLSGSDSAAEMCVSFASCGDPGGGNSLLDLRQNPAESRHWIDRALDACRRLGWQKSEAVFRYHLAAVVFGDGRFDEATLHAEAALGHFREVGDDRQAAITLNLLGVLALAKGDAETATIYVEEALPVFRSLACSEDVAFTLPLLAQAYLKLSRFADALRVAEEARVLAREQGDHRNAVAALQKMARAFTGLGRLDEALAAEAEATAILEGSDSRQATWSTGLGTFDLVRLLATKTGGDFQKLEQDLIAFRKIGNWLGEGFALACLGVANVRHGDRQAGVAFLERALGVFAERQYVLGVNVVRKHLADAGVQNSEPLT